MELAYLSVKRSSFDQPMEMFSKHTAGRGNPSNILVDAIEAGRGVCIVLDCARQPEKADFGGSARSDPTGFSIGSKGYAIIWLSGRASTLRFGKDGSSFGKIPEDLEQKG